MSIQKERFKVFYICIYCLSCFRHNLFLNIHICFCILHFIVALSSMYVKVQYYGDFLLSYKYQKLHKIPNV